MNKVMILAILVAYKAFNDKSLTIVTDDYVVNFAVIDTIDDNIVSLLSYANDDNYGRITINIDDIRAETALKTYLYNTNAVNLNHTQYLIMLGIAKNCWYFKRPIYNYSIRKFLNGNR